MHVSLAVDVSFSCARVAGVVEETRERAVDGWSAGEKSRRVVVGHVF
jgi:hypothetical protein